MKSFAILFLLLSLLCRTAIALLGLIFLSNFVCQFTHFNLLGFLITEGKDSASHYPALDANEYRTTGPILGQFFTYTNSNALCTSVGIGIVDYRNAINLYNATGNTPSLFLREKIRVNHFDALPYCSRNRVGGYFDVGKIDDSYFSNGVERYAFFWPVSLSYSISSSYKGSASITRISFAAPNWMGFLFIIVVIYKPLKMLYLNYHFIIHEKVKSCCPACGYDLRGTPERCPECGRETTAIERQKIALAGRDLG